MKRITSKYLPVLFNDPGLAFILSVGCRFSSRRSQTLGNVLSLSLFSSSALNRTWLHVQDLYVCGLNTCHFCNSHSKEHKSVVSCATGKKVHYSHRINCSNTIVVYLIECTVCKLQCIGSTIHLLRARISEHYNRASCAIFGHLLPSCTHQTNHSNEGVYQG